MTDHHDNRHRVRSAGVFARAMAGCLDNLLVWAVAGGLAILTVAMMSLAEFFSGRPVGFTDLSSQVFACLLAGVAVVLHSSWMAGRGGPAQRSIGVRVVDASTYASIGLVRAMVRWILRELQFAIALYLSTEWVTAHLPVEHGFARGWRITAWIVACRAAPLIVGWFLPRRRSLHDLLTHTIVIDSTATARRPVVTPQILTAYYPAEVASLLAAR